MLTSITLSGVNQRMQRGEINKFVFSTSAVVSNVAYRYKHIFIAIKSVCCFKLPEKIV